MPEARTGRTLLRQEVTEGIKRYILDNGLRPGDPLPTEGALCQALGASRSSVREAVKTLDALDIVDVRQGLGTYVGRLSLSALVESLAFRGLLGPADGFRTFSELAEVREIFERGMAGRLLSCLDEERLDRLDALVDGMEHGRAEGGEEYEEIHREFHTTLVAPLGNELAAQLCAAFREAHEIVAPGLGMTPPEDEPDSVRRHRRLVEAARAGDTEGFVQAFTEHYASLRHRIDAARSRSAREG